MSLTLEQATRIADGALTEARRVPTRPLGVIVLDAGGHPIVFKRENGASLFRFDIARAKAMGALGMGLDTRELAARAANNPTFFNSAAIATQGNLVFSPGGVLVHDANGTVLGAVGVSGDTGDIDEQCALKGLATAGFHHLGSKS